MIKWMPPSRLQVELSIFCDQSCPTGRTPQGRLRTSWRDYISQLAWGQLGISQEELESVAGIKQVWLTFSTCCLGEPHAAWKEIHLLKTKQKLGFRTYSSESSRRVCLIKNLY